jgi:hypothetical protein
MMAPLGELARSEARKTTCSAILSGRAARPSGTLDMIAAKSSPIALMPGVLVGPGETALTRTACGPYSAAQASATSAVAAYHLP